MKNINLNKNYDEKFFDAIVFKKRALELFVELRYSLTIQIKEIFSRKEYQKIALFGASAQATTIINFLNKEQLGKISVILDNDAQKQGKYIFGCMTPISSRLLIFRTRPLT